jgi:hypothetical protein
MYAIILERRLDRLRTRDRQASGNLQIFARVFHALEEQ